MIKRILLSVISLFAVLNSFYAVLFRNILDLRAGAGLQDIRSTLIEMLRANQSPSFLLVALLAITVLLAIVILLYRIFAVFSFGDRAKHFKKLRRACTLALITSIFYAITVFATYFTDCIYIVEAYGIGGASIMDVVDFFFMGGAHISVISSLVLFVISRFIKD